MPCLLHIVLSFLLIYPSILLTTFARSVRYHTSVTPRDPPSPCILDIHMVFGIPMIRPICPLAQSILQGSEYQVIVYSMVFKIYYYRPFR